MRIASVSLVLAAVFSFIAAPAADAVMWSSLKASTNKYDVRAAIRAKKESANKKAVRPASVELPAVAKGGLLFGDAEATTTIVMFTDIECPFCKTFHKKTYPALKKAYIDTKNVRFVIRHFPLSFHRNARPAAETVVCAREKSDDKARALYAELIAMSPLDGAEVEAVVVDLGLDPHAVAACMDGEKTRKTIDADIAVGKDAGVTGTPSFLIIGPTGKKTSIVGAVLIEAFAKAIDEVQSAKN